VRLTAGKRRREQTISPATASRLRWSSGTDGDKPKEKSCFFQHFLLLFSMIPPHSKSEEMHSGFHIFSSVPKAGESWHTVMFPFTNGTRELVIGLQ
jgi:hypothetical protein